MRSRHNRKWSTTAERSMMQMLAVSEGPEVYGCRRLRAKSRSSHKAHISNIRVITSNVLWTVKFAVFFHRLLLISPHFWPFLCSNQVKKGGEGGSRLADSGRGWEGNMDDATGELKINRNEKEERKKERRGEESGKGLEQKWPMRCQKRRGREKRSDREIKKVGQLVNLGKIYRAHRV